MTTHRRVVASAPRSRTSGALAQMLGSAFRWAALASRQAEPAIGGYRLRPIRPRCVSWKDVASLSPYPAARSIPT